MRTVLTLLTILTVSTALTALTALTVLTIQLYSQALADFNEALAFDGTYCQAYTNRGNCWRQQSHHHEAMADYDTAILHEPHNPKAFNNRGALALKMGRWTPDPPPKHPTAGHPPPR